MRHVPARVKHEPAFKSIRPNVLERDGIRCAKCGSTLALEVHHIEGYRHCEPELLIALCYLCHGVAPIGKEECDQWFSSGESGIDVLQGRMIQNGFLGVTSDLIVGFCSTLMEFGYELRKTQLRNARERTRKQTGRCEGRKPFGAYPTEDAVLKQMVSLYIAGMNPVNITAHLNSAGLPTRSGKPWRATSIRKILAREITAYKGAKRPRQLK